MTGKKLTILILCIVCVFTLVMSGYTAAGSDEVTVDATVPIYINGNESVDGYIIGDTTYTSIRSLCEALCEDINFRWKAKTKTLTLTAEGLELTATVDNMYICANERYLYVAKSVMIYDDNVIVPVRTIADVFGAAVEWDSESSSVSISAENLTMIESGDTFYNENDLYWLSRLINSEGGNQPMDGKIAIGNVVMNRVASDSCPDNIYDVIFDAKYGVQFSVVTTKAIYLDPNEESIVAAKLCLEGASVIGTDCIYFVNPDMGATNWFRTTRTYIGTYGDHDFYA